MPVNGYRWFRGFNDYDNWQASGVSGQGARSFYYPAKPQTCADCHMPLVTSTDPAAKNGMVRSHRFPGANTALPFVNHDPVQLKAVQDFLRDGQISVDVFAHRPRRGGRAGGNAGGGSAVEPRDCRARSRSARSRRSSAPAGGRRRRPAEVLGAARQDARCRSAAANRSASKWSSARARSGTSFPAAPSTRSTSGSSSRRSTISGRVLLHSGAVADDGKRPGRPGRALLPQPAARRARQPDQQAQRVDDALGGVRAADPARRRRHRSLPPADSRRRRRSHLAAGQGQLPQVRLVEHAVGVRRRARSGAAGAARSRASYDDGRWLFTGDTSKVSGADQGDPGHPDHGDGRVAGVARRRRAKRAAAGRRSRVSTRRSASAGTTTASACCCRAI